MKSYEFEVNGTASLDVHMTAGRLNIRKAEAGKVKVEVETKDPRFEVEQRGNTIYISSDRETRWTSAHNAAHVVVEVPEGADATIATAAAKIDASVRLGDVYVKSAAADVDLSEIRGGTFKTATGDIEIGVASDYVKVSSASGDIALGECRGKGEFSVASGDVHIRNCEGPVSASSASGDITLGRFAGDRGSFKTMSGDVIVGVPAGTKIDLDVTALSGELRLPDRPADAEPVTPTRKMSIRAKLVSGDLILNRVTD